MKNLLLLILFVIAGCSAPRPEMAHVDDHANFDKDYDECLDEAEQSLSGNRSKFSNITVHDSILEKRILLCMKYKGWHRTNN